MDDPIPASKQYLRDQARRAREIHGIPAVCGPTNKCDPVANEFAAYLEEAGYDAYGATYAPFQGTKKHFVALVPTHEVAFTDAEGYVVIDATIKQFDERVTEDLPKIAILPPGDGRRQRWYESIRTPST